MGSYIVIDDFRAGMDRRKTIATAPAGSVWRLLNGHITRGGEAEKRKAFVERFVLPAGLTKGLAASGTGLYVFGNGATPSGMPSLVGYQQIADPSDTASAIYVIKDWDVFAGKLYVVAEYLNGHTRHFFNAASIADWNSGSYVAAGPTLAVLTLGSKLYATGQYTLYFPKLDDPTSWTAGTGYGAIDMSSKFGTAEALTGLEAYADNLAIFQRQTIQIWAIDDDPTQNRKLQVLNNIGTYAPRTPTNFGDQDVFFLSDSGVRSLRARDSSNSAATYDVGVPMDSYIQEYLATLTEAQRARAIGIVEQSSGRFWLIAGTRIFVFSFFPSSKISAWSEYEPGFEISDAAIFDGRLYVRSGDTIYLYGGIADDEYDASTFEIILPFADGGKPATSKNFEGVDFILQGTWTIEAGTDLTDPDVREEIAVVTASTPMLGKVAFQGDATAVSFKLTHTEAEYALLSRVMVHHKAYKDD